MPAESVHGGEIPQTNPNDTMASFAEAMRKGRIIKEAPPNLAYIQPVKWEPIPVFDFDNVFALGLDIPTVFEQARSSMREGALALPFEKFALLMTATSSEIVPGLGRRVFEQILFVVWPKGNDVVFSMFSRDHYPGGWQPWVASPPTAVWSTVERRFRTVCCVYGGGTPQLLEDADVEAMKDVRGYLYIMLGILQHRGTATSDAPETDYSRTVNRGRERGGLGPLPAVRVINPRAVPGRPIAGSGTGTGSPKRPHLRRGHLRHLSDGRIVVVPPMAIRGGGDAPTYRIKSNPRTGS